MRHRYFAVLRRVREAVFDVRVSHDRHRLRRDAFQRVVARVHELERRLEAQGAAEHERRRLARGACAGPVTRVDGAWGRGQRTEAADRAHVGPGQLTGAQLRLERRQRQHDPRVAPGALVAGQRGARRVAPERRGGLEERRVRAHEVALRDGALAREEHGHGSRRPERRRRAAADGFERLGGQLVEEHFREAPAVGRSPEALGVVLHVVREGLRDDVVLFYHVAARERAVHGVAQRADRRVERHLDA